MHACCLFCMRTSSGFVPTLRTLLKARLVYTFAFGQPFAEGLDPVVHVPGLMNAMSASPLRCPMNVMAQPLMLKKCVQRALFVLPVSLLKTPQSKANVPTADLVVSWVSGAVSVANRLGHHHGGLQFRRPAR